MRFFLLIARLLGGSLVVEAWLLLSHATRLETNLKIIVGCAHSQMFGAASARARHGWRGGGRRLMLPLQLKVVLVEPRHNVVEARPVVGVELPARAHQHGDLRR